MLLASPGMLGALLTLTLCQTPAIVTELTASSRDPLAVLLILPTGVEGKVSSADILGLTAKLVDARTDFRVERIESSRAAGCKGLLSCLVDRVRDDWEPSRRFLDNGTMRPYSEHLAELARKETPYPRYLLLISNLTGDDEDLLEVTLIDTDAALALRHEETPEGSTDPTALETRLAKSALVGGPAERAVASSDLAEAFLEEFFIGRARRKLTDAGHWEPFGTVEIKAPPGLAIRIDSKTVGTTGSGLTRLIQVHAGRRTLKLTGPGYMPFETRFDLERKDSVQLAPTLLPSASPLTAGARTAVFWGGVAVAAAGVGVTGYALSQPSGDVTVFCPSGNSNCGGSFTSLGYDPQSPGFGDGNGSGVKTAPLGLALLGTGAAWSLGTMLFGEDEDWPWIQIAGGILVGGLTYGLGHGLSN